jgi:hypothetical protein
MRAIRQSEASVMESKGCGVRDTPQEPVIGLAEGETRWRSMTTIFAASPVSGAIQLFLLRRQGWMASLVMTL